MRKPHKHDRYLTDLSGRIAHCYDEIRTNVFLYSKRKRKIAEIDILAIKGKHCDVYEVKCSYRIVKARRQLTKIKKVLPHVKTLFFFCGESGSLEVIR